MGHLFSSDYQLSSFNSLVYALERSMGGGKSVEGARKEQALYPNCPLHPADLQQELSFLLCEMGGPSCLRGLILSTT